jgi:hypothetical protein
MLHDQNDFPKGKKNPLEKSRGFSLATRKAYCKALISW